MVHTDVDKFKEGGTEVVVDVYLVTAPTHLDHHLLIGGLRLPCNPWNSGEDVISQVTNLLTVGIFSSQLFWIEFWGKSNCID
jgi:hypothetical protein